MGSEREREKESRRQTERDRVAEGEELEGGRETDREREPAKLLGQDESPQQESEQLPSMNHFCSILFPHTPLFLFQCGHKTYVYVMRLIKIEFERRRGKI